MSESNTASKSRRDAFEEVSPLDTLSRTLEDLEQRLARMNLAKRDASLRSGTASGRPRFSTVGGKADPSGTSATPIPSADVHRDPVRSNLSDTVSQIAMRQKALDEDAESFERRRSVAASRRHPSRPGALSDVGRELERLREELRRDIGTELEHGLKPRLDEIRGGFDDLRQMIGDRAGSSEIETEIARLSDGLEGLIATGADRHTMMTLKSELDGISALVGQMAREDTVRAVGERWDAFETTMSGRAEADDRSRRDIKSELERLRTSMASLASEDHVAAVERRLEQFETMFGAAPKVDEAAISEIIKGEMATLREKLEEMASETSAQAVENRWDALEEHLATRESEAARAIENKMEAMAVRIGQIEESLDKLPQIMSIAPLEERVQALATAIEVIAAKQKDDEEADHFGQLEERLDEISRAIVAASNRPQTMDMSPIERIEARLQSLASRVEEVAEGSDTDLLTRQIIDLSDRIEALSNDPAARELSDRMERFSGHIDQLVASSEAAAATSDALEARMRELAEQIEEVSHSRVDEAMVKSLEAQIGRLSELFSESGIGATLVNPELDARLSEIERRLDDNREQIIASAKEAADEAVRQMLESGDLRHSEHVAKLTEGLHALETLSRESGTQTHEFFTAVHATLKQLVERIGKIETEISTNAPDARPASPEAVKRVEDAVFSAFAAAQDEDGDTERTAEETSGLRSMLGQMRRNRQAASSSSAATSPVAPAIGPSTSVDAAAAVSAASAAPSLDDRDGDEDPFASREANRPLAIGSGAPNVMALLERVRSQQAERSGEGEIAEVGTSDFIAAARRAAVAAAAEADSLRTRDEVPEEGKGAFSDALSRRRKPILMAMGAVILALMALPLGHALLASPDAEGTSSTIESAGQQGAAQDAATVPTSIASNETAPGVDGTAGAGGPQTAVATEPAVQPAIVASAQGAGDQVAAPAAGTAASWSESPYMSPAALSSSGLHSTDDSAPAGVGEASQGPETAQPAIGDGPLVVPAANEPKASDVSAAGAAAAASAATAIPAMPKTIGTPALASAVDAADPKALFEVGLRLMEGQNAAPSPQSAAQWFEASATRGFAPAQYSLGTLYEKGNGVERNTSTARDWYVKAADQGNVRAMHNLAVLYATGVDGKSDPKLAAQWFEKAAAHGMTDSQYNLGILFARGAGVEQDLVQSYKWFAIVAAGGDKDSAGKRDEIAKSLSATQLVAAKEAVATFKPLPRDEAANTVDIPADWSRKSVDPVQTSSVDMKKAIRNIQAILTKLGYDAGVPDGVAGQQTAEAIRAFQKDAGLTVSGQIDEPLIRELLKRKDSSQS